MADNFNGRMGNVMSSETLLTPRTSKTYGFGDGDSDVVLAGSGSGPIVGAVRINRNKPRIKRFCNGVRVPVFEASDSEDGIDINENSDSHVTGGHPSLWCGKFPDLSSTEATELMELFKCPICQDYMVEATAASCGHTFCSACLDKWTKLKPICPICSKHINCRIRLYNEDLLVEKMVNRCEEDFPQEIARSLYEASKSRMDRQQNFKSSHLGRIRNCMDEMVNSLRCKGLWQCIKNSGAVKAIQRYWMERQSRPEPEVSPETAPLAKFGAKFYLITGVIIGALIMKTYTQYCGVLGEISFPYYLYLCITHYDGSIPDFLKFSPQDDMKSLPLDEFSSGGSWLNWITNSFHTLI